jgi:thiol-disulfide isomerase/thioredoxin
MRRWVAVSVRVSRPHAVRAGAPGRLPAALVIAAAALVSPGSSLAGPPASEHAGGTAGAPAAPAVTAPAPVDTDAAGVERAVRSARGDVVLVNVWATWCDPCRHEFPTLLRVRRELSTRGFRLILVSADFPDQRPKVMQFLARQGVGFKTFLKAENDMAFINALDPRWSGALPATFLYDRSGKLRDFWEGETDYKVLVTKVRALLDHPPQSPVPQGGSR